MREIKFRAWDKEEQRYWSQEEMTEIGGFYYSYGVDPDLDRFILQQYTGLKDKNGKEIYEGDIVNVCNNKQNLCVGHFHFGGWQLYIYNTLPETPKLEEGNCLATYVSSPTGNWESRIEVIGDIYQNKDLL